MANAFHIVQKSSTTTRTNIGDRHPPRLGLRRVAKRNRCFHAGPCLILMGLQVKRGWGGVVFFSALIDAASGGVSGIIRGGQRCGV